MRMKKPSFLREGSILQRLLHWLLQPARIPLLFSVTVMCGMLYHYAPSFMPVWIVLSVVIQAALFRLFDFVKVHPVIGGAAYVAVGALFLVLASVMIDLGYSDAVFGPKDLSGQMYFWVWFMTPQAVLITTYPGYVIALFLLFTFFIASIAYYFTFVRYRVLMSFVVMLFPFAIYAKENETMPIISIIILLFCYFAVMIYCRQAHAEDSAVVQTYVPYKPSMLSQPSRKSPYAKVRPEILDNRFLEAGGLFLAAASILIFVIPKPTVQADRSVLDAMIDFSSLSAYLDDVLDGFLDTSDGGSYSNMNYTRMLYYANGSEPSNLRVRTFTDYHYGSDSWSASAYDMPPALDFRDYPQKGHYLYSASDNQTPAELIALVQYAVQNDPAFAEKWHLEPLAEMHFDPSAYTRELAVKAAGYTTGVYPAPLHTSDISSESSWGLRMYQNKSDIIYRSDDSRFYLEAYYLRYCSESVAESDAAQLLMAAIPAEEWHSFLSNLFMSVPSENTAQSEAALLALRNYRSATTYMESVHSETPESVRQLAEQITEGLTTDYEKACAIRDYLRSGSFTYSLEFQKAESDNVETFLFRNRTGVCYQFACAMSELCRAVGLPVRYVEGYMMGEPSTRQGYNYQISTRHAHAFTDVYITGYGWMMFDATAASAESNAQTESGVLVMLQYSGLILFGAAVLLIIVLVWLIPTLREKFFRRKFRRELSAAYVQKGFARLRKQWKADPAKTARVLCEEQGAFLGLDLQALCAGIETTVYADQCPKETAERFYQAYCAAYDAYRPAVRAHRKAQRAAQKQTAASAKAGA